jgi:uncharacterized cofD-like protein
MIRIVAFGGGHGLATTLRALRTLRKPFDLDITAVVTVGDDGGSSGRLIAERNVPVPPGDLRQALAALADDTDPTTKRTAELFQHRFGGHDSLAGHPVGNLVLCGLMEQFGDPITALDHAATLVRAAGRVLPMAMKSVQIEADVYGGDPAHPDEVVVVRGQHQVAVARGVVHTVRLTPAPHACPEAIEAVRRADWLIFGPGSWYTSVIPHLLVPEIADAVARSAARKLVTLNLAMDQETHGLSLPDHLAALTRYLPGLRADVVLADGKAVGEPEPVHRAAESLGARLVLAPVAVPGGAARHDPAALAVALEPILVDG